MKSAFPSTGFKYLNSRFKISENFSISHLKVNLLEYKMIRPAVICKSYVWFCNSEDTAYHLCAKTISKILEVGLNSLR